MAKTSGVDLDDGQFPLKPKPSSVTCLCISFISYCPDHLLIKILAFQFLIVMSICTNCVLLVCLYDQEGKWKIEPGLAAILIIEHVLLLLKFVFSRFVPEVILLLLFLWYPVS